MDGEDKIMIDLVQNQYLNTSKSNSNWMDKLKPSQKNLIIHKKYKNLNNPIMKQGTEELGKYLGVVLEDKRSIDYENRDLEEDFEFENENNNEEKSIISMKWEQYLLMSKDPNNKPKDLDFINQSMVANAKENEVSVLSENLEEINFIIEEKYKVSVTENVFLRGEYHSIIPFILISCSEIHRMVLSDYEIKEITRQFIKKAKRNRLEYFDYYRMGLIAFYKGNYSNAHSNFKSAHKIANNRVNTERENLVNLNSISNISKWLAFTGLIILLCQNKVIDFTSLKKNLLNEDMTKETESSILFFSCCSARKRSNTSNKVNNIFNLINQGSNQVNNNNSMNSEHDYTNSDSYLSKLDTLALAAEIEELIKVVKENEQNALEGWWLQMYIAIYCTINKQQKNFEKFSANPFDPKYCVKKIKQFDGYLSYIAYVELKFILDENFKIDKILAELIIKYPNKFEGYLKYWQLLIKKDSPFKNYKKAHTISEIFWKKSASIKFDENEKSIYYIYVLLSHAKSSFLIGNSVYTISFYQKEFTSNFLYPSIYYLFAKYASKSNSKNLKTTAISSLQEVFRLLGEDLQYTSYYWLGNIYHNIGDYRKCYKIWKKYLENNEKSFNPSQKKIDRIISFIKIYELLCDNLIQFKKNLLSAKKCSTTIDLSDIENYFADLELLKKIVPNIKYKYLIRYEYYRALIFLNVVKNYEEALRLLTNILNEDNTFIQAGITLWEMLKHKGSLMLESGRRASDKDRILLKLSYFILKVAQSEEVPLTCWIKSWIIYAKSLYFNKKFEQATQVLISLLDIFANIPHEEIKFLSEINKDNKISITNVFVNFELALNFYSKFHVYRKCEDIFQDNYMKRNNYLDNLNEFIACSGEHMENIDINNHKDEDNLFAEFAVQHTEEENDSRSYEHTFTKSNANIEIDINVDDVKEGKSENTHKSLNNAIQKNTSGFIYDPNFVDLSNEFNFINDEMIEKEFKKITQFENKKVPDLNIKTISKLEEYLDNNIDNIEIQEDNFTCSI